MQTGPGGCGGQAEDACGAEPGAVGRLVSSPAPGQWWLWSPVGPGGPTSTWLWGWEVKLPNSKLRYIGDDSGGGEHARDSPSSPFSRAEASGPVWGCRGAERGCRCCLRSLPVEPKRFRAGDRVSPPGKTKSEFKGRKGQDSEGGQTQLRSGLTLNLGLLKGYRAMAYLLCVRPPPPLGRSEETEQETHRSDPHILFGPLELLKPSLSCPPSLRALPAWSSPLPPISKFLFILRNPTRSHTSSRLVSETP